MKELNFNYISRLIPAAYQMDGVKHTQASILITLITFNIVFCLLSFPYIQFGLSGIDHAARMVGHKLILFTITIYLLALIPYYGFKQLKAAGHMVTLGVFAPALVGMMITGGYTHSPVPVLLVIAPVFALLLMGLAAGVLWTFLALGAQVVMWWLEQTQMIHPVQMLNADASKSLALALPMTIGVMVMGAMMIYEFITMRLRQELQQEKNKFKWEATHDALTGLPNRPEFFHRLELGIRNAEVNKQELALVCLDLDGFKPVNDTLGHHAGDEVLRVVSKRMQTIVRGSDSVARLGGDEFAIILQGVTADKEVMNTILSKILKVISEQIILDGKEVSVSASIGVAYFDANDVDVAALCRKADSAMYKTKEKKNSWCFYS